MKSKIIEWFAESDRYKHLAGGAVIGMGADSLYCAAYAGTGVAAALELKDRKHGGKWDWIDLAVTVAGVAAGYSLRLTVTHLLK